MNQKRFPLVKLWRGRPCLYIMQRIGKSGERIESQGWKRDREIRARYEKCGKVR